MLDKRYLPVILHDKETIIVISTKTAALLCGVNIHYSPADYFLGVFNRGFVFTSKNVNHDFCPCGNLIIKS